MPLRGRVREMRMRRGTAAATLAVALCLASAAFGQEQPPADERPFTLRSALKSSALFSRSPDIASGVVRNDSSGFWRFRLEPTFRTQNNLTADFALEQRLRVSSLTVSPNDTGGLLPSSAAAPFRVRQLDWRLASGANGEWRAEIDRAELHARISRADLTIGRQAIGWGRGALFGAVDLFSPFSPLEVDREWRRGVDAVRADVKLTDRVSLDSVAAFGETIPQSAFVSRLRGYARRADLEVLGGYRARDLFAGVTSSAPIGDFEVHGEVAVFRTGASSGSLAFGDTRLPAKAVAGGSYRIPFANGILTFVEYHYSGFGASSSAGIAGLVHDPAFQVRYFRGDTQILGRHALAVLASYEFSPELATSNTWIQSPTDGSGVIVPAMTWTLSDRWSVFVSGDVPYGRPIGATSGSEFGSSPLAAFLQIRSYW